MHWEGKGRGKALERNKREKYKNPGREEES